MNVLEGQVRLHTIVFRHLQVGGITLTWITECSQDKDGNWDCHALGPKPKPPGIDQAIANTVNEVGPSNPNDSKDLGGMQTDKGITKSPIE